jgi:excinuclease ABC subunit C
MQAASRVKPGKPEFRGRSGGSLQWHQATLAFRDPVVIEIANDLDAADGRIAAAPDRPAVFLIRPREGAPYLARTNALRRRLKRLLGARPGVSRLLNLRALADRVEYWPAGSRLEAMLIQYHLAVRHFREHYLELLKLRMPPYLKLTLANPFPRTQVTARLAANGLYYGPFRSRGGAELFESQVLELFQIRRCQEDLEPAPEHPGCIYGEMNKCMRPCQQLVGPEEYRGEVTRVIAFLQTGGRSLVEPLQAARERLSVELRFEDAAREHRQIEKVEEVLRLRDDLVFDIDRLNGIAVTPSAEPGAVELWFVLAGCWQPPVRFGVEASGEKTVSLDHRLHDVATALEPRRPGLQARQEHLALLARWYYSSWRDGDWLPFADLDHLPYRKLVRAISRRTMKPAEPPAASGRS